MYICAFNDEVSYLAQRKSVAQWEGKFVAVSIGQQHHTCCVWSRIVQRIQGANISVIFVIDRK